MNTWLLTVGFWLLASCFWLFTCSKADAVVDPLSKPNNFIGIHILFADELKDAARLVNSNNGDWGYVTVPIQSTDKNLEKWQEFMDTAGMLHVVPIVRLATQNDPYNTSVWEKPTDYDIIDFANFLNSLNWPTKNRYVILFNEVNRSDEWGGEAPNPAEYASLVSYANEVFKSRSQDFYLILSGLDAAAPNDYVKYISGFTYLESLISVNVQDSIDGFSSHSYPNPAFSAVPSETKKIGVATYRFEYDMINENSNKKIPVFITETGWSTKNLSEQTAANYLSITLKDIWEKDRDKIIAITPFLLNAGPPFDIFSFMKDGRQGGFYEVFAKNIKVKGAPEVSKTQIVKNKVSNVSSELSFKKVVEGIDLLSASPYVKLYFKTILGIN